MSARYFVNDQEQITKSDYYSELTLSLERISTFNPPVQTCSTGWSFSGFFKGPTSIAYLFYRLSLHYPDLEFKQQSLLEWAEAYLQLGSFVKKTDPDPSHCGIANETLAHTALSSVVLNDVSLVQRVCAYESVINNPDDDGSNEWLYGRAGYLYFLRLCLSHFTTSSPSAAKVLAKTIEKTVERILYVPLPWTWHGKEYLGAAHGTIGIICQVILSGPKQSSTKSIMQQLIALLQTQFNTGNFPSSLPDVGRDELVQFCHGGPGFVMSLRSIEKHIRKSPETAAILNTIHTAITQAQSDIWQRGLLRKDPCLCHGIAGNALAFDNDEAFDTFLTLMTSQALEERGWLEKAGHTDVFASLFGGEAGRAWVWTVADKKLERTCVGFNDI